MAKTIKIQTIPPLAFPPPLRISNGFSQTGFNGPSRGFMESSWKQQQQEEENWSWDNSKQCIKTKKQLAYVFTPRRQGNRSPTTHARIPTTLTAAASERASCFLLNPKTHGDNCANCARSRHEKSYCKSSELFAAAAPCRRRRPAFP